MTPAPIASIGKGISVSTDGGKNYTFLDCGWADGRGESILYQIYWDESGRYTLTVINVNEGITSQFTGKLPTSAVTMLGVGVFGSFDRRVRPIRQPPVPDHPDADHAEGRQQSGAFLAGRICGLLPAIQF